jgi:predicted secreted protein
LGLTGSIILFLIIWWLILFILLPISIDNKTNNTIEYEGNDRGAPNNPKLLKKFIITTIISVILWFVVYLLLNNDGFLMFIMNTFYINEIN